MYGCNSSSAFLRVFSFMSIVLVHSGFDISGYMVSSSTHLNGGFVISTASLLLDLEREQMYKEREEENEFMGLL